MAETSKDFLVSTADVAFMVNGQLAFTGTTSLNTSISVSMEDQEITGGKGNKTLYKYKYGRKLAPSIEMAEWNLAYIAANAGSKIMEDAKDVFAVAELVSLENGAGTLSKTPVGEVFVELSDGSTCTVMPEGDKITVENAGDAVRATYRYNATVKHLTIDAESTPLVGELILTADKHNNLTGKVGEVQIDVPSFQLSGTFDISLEASGSTTTKLDGDALAVEDANCKTGPVYAYITEIPSVEAAVLVSEIAATPADMNLAVGDTKQISVVGIKGGMYSNVGIDAAACTFTSDKEDVATVVNGEVSAVSAGEAQITVAYGDIQDIVTVTVA